MEILGYIPEDRPLSPQEATLVRWLLEHSGVQAAAFLPQLDRIRVSSRCTCGCASVDFAVGGIVPPLASGMQILVDYVWESAEGYLFGVFVFAKLGLLAGIEVWSVDGLADARSLPSFEQLLAFESNWLP